MEVVLQILLLVLGFVMLIKGADWFVEGASQIADRIGIPQLIIGLTIVAMGTSLPEAAVSISASLKDSASIAVGNVLGSNIMNMLLILGLTALITPLAVQKSTARIEIPFVILISVVLVALGLTDNVVGRLDGILLWVLFLCYLGYLFWMAKKGIVPPGEEDDGPQKQHGYPMLILMILGGGALIALGSDFSVDAASALARLFGMTEQFIGLTIVALGTSLPELVTSVTAALKKKTDIAVGNIVGSNIFNILFVLGTSAIIKPVGYESKFWIDSLVCIATPVLLLACVLNRKRKLNRLGGGVMLACFIAYFVYLCLKIA